MVRVKNMQITQRIWENSCWVLVVHACNSNYSGGRDQEDGGSKIMGQIVWHDHILKNPSQK
jgi:hypothetical protein